MSDFIAEARVLVTPDTTKFRGLLEAQLAAASSKPLVVPVTFTATGTEGAAAASKKAETAKQAETAATRALEKSELALVAAQEKALLSTTQLGAARARLTGAITAVKQAEIGLAAAERSKNALLIEDAQATLALAEAEEVRARGVARTIILANAQAAALAATAASAAEAAAATATQTKVEQEAAGIKQALVTATAAQVRGTAELAEIQALAAKSANDLATAQLRTLTAASEQGAAQVTAAAAVRTAAIAQEQLTLALATGNVQLVEAAALTTLLASAHEAQALAALSATRAESAHAATLGQVQKAGFAGAASMLGLRGAVLTAGTAFLGATVGITAFAKAVQSAADLETELNVFRITARATGDEMERVSQQAQALGRDITLPGVAAGDAAEAMTLLAKAGLDVQNSLSGARGVLQLATAAQIDNAKAAELVANALNSFRLGGEEAVRVADLLTGAANESQGSIEDMGIGLRQVSGAAVQLGLSVEDTVALLTQLTRAGLAGSDAGTTLRVALVRLAKPETRVEVEKLVGSLEDLNGNLDPEKIVQFAEEIGKSGSKLDQTNKLYELFGENSLRVIGLLSGEGVQGFRDISDATQEAGLAAESSAARMAGFQGDVENLKNQMAALGIAVGQLAIPPLSLMAQTLAEVARAANDTIAATRNLISEVAGLGKPFADAIPFLDQAESHLGGIIKTAAKFQLLGPGITVASLALDRFGDSSDEASGDVDKLTSSLANFDREMRRTKESLEGLGDVGAAADPGLNVQQILNRVTGFDSAEVRARIEGDTAEIVSVLRDAQAFLEGQLQREFVKRRPALQRQLEQALFGVTNDLAAIASTGAADAKRAADDAARAISDADQALLDALSQRREDVQRRITAAGGTEGARDDIRAQNALQALIKQQIQKIRDRVKDEKERRDAIRLLRQALIDSRREEEALRDEQRKAEQARRDEAQARRDQVQQLNIDIAEERGNRTALERAINARITTLNKQIKAAKGDQVRVKQLILERERLRNQLEEATEEEKKSGKSAQQFFFEQLQAQQGFASNLMGNLITGPTAGLVGQPSPTTVPSTRQVAQEAKAAGPAGPTSGQANTTNGLLERILNQLQRLNGTQDHPEATRQRAVGAPGMDGAGNISGM